MENKQDSVKQVLRRQPRWETLYFYQKSVVLYQMTFFFTKRFLRKGDRTVDQMVQAARSGKQNIVEGSADGVTSMEMEIKLMNAARGSIQELQKDYEDYLVSRGQEVWIQAISDMSGCCFFAVLIIDWRIISLTSKNGATKRWLMSP